MGSSSSSKIAELLAELSIPKMIGKRKETEFPATATNEFSKKQSNNNKNVENKYAQPEQESSANSSRRTAPLSGVIAGSSSLFTGFVQNLSFRFGEELMNKYSGLIGSEKNEELEKKWVQLGMEEMELLKKKCDIVNEAVTAALEVLRSDSVE